MRALAAVARLARLATLPALAALSGCLPRPGGPSPRIGDGRAPTVRVALGASRVAIPLEATGGFVIQDARGATLARVPRGERWQAERHGETTRAIRFDGTSTPWRDGPLNVVPERGAALKVAGKAYRGQLRLVPTDSGLLVVNLLALDDYLLGVVPLELGERPRAERAALEAQAIAARSFTLTRIAAARAGNGRSVHFDLVPSTADQVYGGMDAEQPNASAAVRATAGQVLRYGDRVIVAPYHSTCGGETAAAQEIWRSDGEPYLRRVSDRMPGRAERYYCDIAPRFYWERALSGDELDAVVARYLRSYASVPAAGPGTVRDLRVAARTASGRVDVLELRTAGGVFELRGNDARSVVRTPAGELLPSPYFSVSVTPASDGGIARVLLRGNGFGHGVGMCQWGAIGRARAGQSARSILRTYFPGTSVGPIPSRYLSS